MRAYRELSGSTSVFHAFFQQRCVPVWTRGDFAQQQPVINAMSERFAQCRQNFRVFIVHYSRQIVGQDHLEYTITGKSIISNVTRETWIRC